MACNEKVRRWLVLTVGLMAVLIIADVLWRTPHPGVADQGDFDRVMNVSGLRVSADDTNNPEFVRFLDYTVSDYEIVADHGGSLLKRPAVTSMAYVIKPINQVCLLLGKDTFKTGYLAIFYAFAYTLAIVAIFAFIPVHSHIKLLVFSLISLWVFWDGNYLVWFNSLYGEPMMITSLALYIAAWMYYIHRHYVVKSPSGVFPAIVLIFAAGLLFLGSKLQVLSAWPIIVIMIFTLCWKNRRSFNRRQKILVLLGLLLIVYPLGFARNNKEMGRYTIYNAVFYGILKDSPDPAQDLLNLGISPDLAADAGKHVFLPPSEYKYVPSSQLMQDEFYGKIGNTDLVRYYVTHPARLFTGLEYTASQAFTTSTALGKYPQEYSDTPISEFNRFTSWSVLREKYAPRQLWLLVLFYLLVIGIGTREYLRRAYSAAIRLTITLLAGIMVIGWLQFPMPLVGNGQADTAKQLFLFNFTFDIMVVVSASWLISHIMDYACSPISKIHSAVSKDFDI